MNILKSIIKRHHASSRWALLGGTVLWLSVSIAAPAHAVPTTYTLPGGLFSGTYTLDQGVTPGSFSFWNIDVISGPDYSSLGGSVTDNDTLTGVSTLKQGAPPTFLQLVVNPTGDTFTIQSHYVTAGTLNKIELTAPLGPGVPQVPEPAAAVLLAIGLLALACSRWLPGRGDRQQLG